MTTTLIGYARCSTDKQDLAAQKAALETLGVAADRIYTDHGLTGTNRSRPGLDQALAAVRTGDTLVVPKLDRLARSVAFISNLMEGGVDFVAADMPSVNRLTVHVLAAVAEHEREMISQRTKAALAAAKARGTRLGNPRLPPAGTHARPPEPSSDAGWLRVEAARSRAVAAYADVIEAARAAGARSLGDYAQALQAARLPTPRGESRWSRPSVARVLRYCGVMHA